jgi:hypothetical protein
MANPLGGMFERPEEKRTFGQKAMNAFKGFGAGLAGFGPEFVMMQRQEQQQLDEQRQKAMAKDALTAYQLISDNKIDDAISFVDRRVQYINELGGDPTDTLEIRQMLTTPGRLDEARQELGLFVQASMENGLLPVPERREPIRVGANDRLFDPNTFEEIVSAAPAAQEQEPAAVQSLRIRAAEAGLQPGTQPYVDFMLSGGGGGGGVSVPITVQAAGGPSSKFGEIIDTQLAGYMEQASMSGALGPKLQILEQLAPLTTEGAIPAAISRMFPNYSDANSAFMGLISQTIPDMRVPGSGAQSDKDMEQLFAGFGDLAATPEVKGLLIESLKASADIKQQRADIAQQYLEGTITQPQAARMVRDVNSRSILPARLQGMLGGMGAAGGAIPQAAIDAGLTPQDYAQMTPEEKAAFSR